MKFIEYALLPTTLFAVANADIFNKAHCHQSRPDK